MDDKPRSLSRAHTTLVYLGAGFLLFKSSRAIISWIQSHLWLQKQVASIPSVAFLVDGENVTSPFMERLIERALDEAKKLGEVHVRRVYGGCIMFNTRWNEISLRFELGQIHLVKPTKPTNSKNTADIALAVDAIELAKDGICNRFCIVTSDSDFTPLVRRLRELKCQVLGIGERKTPNTLTKACNWFIFTDQLMDAASTTPPPRNPTSPQTPRSQIPTNPSTEPSRENQPTPPTEQPPAAPQAEKLSPIVITVLTEAYRDAVHGRMGEWVLLSRLGLSLRQLYPDFKAIDYAEDLSALIRQYNTVFEFGKRANGHPQMRLKQ
jgi:uncharacterized LabA/DUF88 family protein